MQAEITVVLKDESRTIRHKFLEYNEFTCRCDDPTILKCIDDARKNFDGEPTDIQIKISMTV